MKKIVASLLFLAGNVAASTSSVVMPTTKVYENLGLQLSRSCLDTDEGKKNSFGVHKVLPFNQAFIVAGVLFDEKCPATESFVINKKGMSDLDMFEGTFNKKACVFNELNQTVTVPGTMFFGSMLQTPTFNVVELHKRQQNSKAFAGTSKAVVRIDNALHKIQDGQKHLFTMINNAYLTERMPEWVKNSWFMRATRKIQDTFQTSPRVSQTLSTLGTIQLAGFSYIFLLEPGYKGMKNLGNMALHPSTATFKDIKSNIKSPLFCALSGYIYYKYKTVMADMEKDQYTSLIAVSKVVRGLKELSLTLKKHPELAVNLEHAQALHDLFDPKSTTISKDMHQLVEILLTNTFTGEPSYFAYEGRITAASVLILRVAKEFGPALYAAGEIDAYLSCAKLLKKYEGTETQYAYASYVKDQKTPSIVVQGLWNPLVNTQVDGHKAIVLNDIVLGLHTPNNGIITGPNAGGKSTFLKGLTLNVVCAQTIGIVPAKSMTLTPFIKINTYMNITDDTAAGKSLFVSEVERAQALLKTIQGLDASEFSFSIMDEMFTGTAAREGEAASYAIARNLGTLKNSILLLATHFPKLQGLEKESNVFMNYQVRVVRHADGSFSYPYKLEKGAANQNVAFDILKSNGFDQSIIDDANRLLHA